MKTIKNYFLLYRVDVALITFMAYAVGVKLARGLEFHDILIALAVSMISVNSIYSINSWADRDIDKINKPERPVPSGKISPQAALNYSIILNVIAFIYPFFIYKSIPCLIMFLLLPVLGLLYSLEPVRLKKFFIPAVVTTTTILMIPIILGYFMNTDSTEKIPFFAVLYCFGLAVIPIKDIEDAKGDTKFNCQNWASKFGVRRVLALSTVILLIDLILTLFLSIDINLKWFLLLLLTGTIVIELLFLLLSKNTNRVYKSIIWFVAAWLASVVLYHCFF